MLAVHARQRPRVSYGGGVGGGVSGGSAMSAAAVSSARWRLSQACMSVATLLLLLLNAWMMGTRLRDVGQTQPNLASSVSFTSGVASIVPTRWEHTMVEVAQQEQAGTHHNGQAAGLFAAAAAADTTPEVWARGPATAGAAQTELTELLGAKAVAELRALCGRCLYRTLTEYVRVHGLGDATIVLTGDIPAMWLRDSAVQIATYLPRLARRPSLRPIIDGAIRAQAYFVLQDPYANAFNPAYVHPTRLSKAERQLGRGGWVWTRNFELDSLAYFFNLLWNYHATPGLWRPGQLLEETIVHDAVVAALRVLEVEQHHEEQSPYRYAELTRDGLGGPCAYTGMVWSGFRASDDPQLYCYNVAANMYLWGALRRLSIINAVVWQDAGIADSAMRLLDGVHAGITAHGLVHVPGGQPGELMYAYEVDGHGNGVLDFDDPNLPSLLAAPLLGYERLDKTVYAMTRKRILSSANPYFFNGTVFRGLGSPHTDVGYVWPLATAVQALTADSAAERAQLLTDLTNMASVNGLVHESVHIDQPLLFTRPEFGWANAMLVVAAEQLLGLDCESEADAERTRAVSAREAAAQEQQAPPNGGADLPAYYEMLEAGIQHEPGALPPPAPQQLVVDPDGKPRLVDSSSVPLPAPQSWVTLPSAGGGSGTTDGNPNREHWTLQSSNSEQNAAALQDILSALQARIAKPQ